MAHITKKVINVGETVSGQAHQVTVFNVKGVGPGPKVYIQANLHGAELQGNAVIYQLLRRLENLEIRGELTIVPQANPIGLNQKSGDYTYGRFDPVTGVNFNRMYHHDLSFLPEFIERNIDASDEDIRSRFRDELRSSLHDALDSPFGLSTARRLCYTLQSMALEADYVLDLHTGPISSKHLYVAEYAQDKASYFNIPHVIIIPNEFDGALDEASFVPWWSLSQAFENRGRKLEILQEAFTVELGSEEMIDLDAAEHDCDSLMSYLSHKDIFVGADFQPLEMVRYGCFLKDYKIVYAPRGGLVEYKAAFGEVLEAGAPLASFLNIDRYGEEDAMTTITLPNPVLPILHNASAALLQGAELYKVFNDFFELS